MTNNNAAAVHQSRFQFVDLSIVIVEVVHSVIICKPQTIEPSSSWTSMLHNIGPTTQYNNNGVSGLNKPQPRRSALARTRS